MIGAASAALLLADRRRSSLVSDPLGLSVSHRQSTGSSQPAVERKPPDVVLRVSWDRKGQMQITNLVEMSIAVCEIEDEWEPCAQLSDKSEDLLRLRIAWAYSLQEARRSHRLRTIGPTRLDNVNTLTRSLRLMHPEHRLRRLCIRIADHAGFDALILALILMNTATLFIGSDPRWKDHTHLHTTLYVLEAVFLGCFLMEIVLKVIACGMIMHRGAFLRNPWNVLDMVVVLAGLVQHVTQGHNTSALRSLRALRPLRSVARVPGLRIVVTTFFRSLPRMRDALLLLLFVVWLFAIVGLMLLQGGLHYHCHLPVGHPVPSCASCLGAGSPQTMYEYKRCGDPSAVLQYAALPNGSAVTEWPTNNSTMSLAIPWSVCNDSDVCSSGGRGEECDPGTECLRRDLMPHGALGFDHILEAAIVVLKVASLDDWPDDLEAHQQRIGHHVWIFFVAITVIGNLLVFNLALAVIATEMEDRIATDEIGRRPSALPNLTPAQAAGAAQALPALAVMLHMHSDASETDEALAALVRELDTPAPGQTAIAVRRGTHYPESVLLGILKMCQAQPDQPRLPQPQLEIDLDDGAVVDPDAEYVEHTMPHSADFEQTPASEEPAESEDPPRDDSILHRAVESRVWYVVTFIVTLANVAALAVDSYPQSDGMTEFVDVVNFACSIFFIAEAAVKVAVLRTQYFSDHYNILDLVLAALSIPDVVGVGSVSGSNSLRVLRALRVLRLVKGTRRMRRVLKTLLQSMSEAVWLMLILLLFLLVCAVVGMQLYPDVVDPAGVKRIRFTSWWEALISVFVFAITGEGWGTALAYVVRDQGWKGGWLYFVFTFLVGNCLLLNGFVAIVSTNFGLAKSADDSDESDGDDVAQSPSPRSNQTQTVPDGTAELWRRLSLASRRTSDVSTAASLLSSPTDAGDAGVEFVYRSSGRTQTMVVRILDFLDDGETKHIDGVSLGLFARDMPLRKALGGVLRTKTYSIAITFLIMVNAVLISLDSPRVQSHSPNLHSFLEVTDYVFAVVFVLECLLNVFVFGLYLESESAYLRDGWNRVDMLVAFSALLATVVPELKPFRALRTLRLIVRLSGTRRVAGMFFATLPEVSDTALLLLFFMFVWAVFGVQLFKGQFYRCTDDSVTERAACNGTFNGTKLDFFGATQQPAERQWVRTRFNFDNIGEAFFTLYLMLVGDGWAEPMFQGIDARGFERSLGFNEAPWYALYFVVFVMVAQFLFVNIFVSLLIDSILQRRQQQRDDQALDRMRGDLSMESFTAIRVSAFEWLCSVQVLRASAPGPLFHRPESPLRQFCFRLATSQWGPLVTRMTADSRIRSRQSATRGITYKQVPLSCDGPIWSDSDAKFTDIPAALRHGSYLRGPSKVRFGTVFTLAVSRPCQVYLMCDAETRSASSDYAPTRAFSLAEGEEMLSRPQRQGYGRRGSTSEGALRDGGFPESLLQEGWREETGQVFYANPHEEFACGMRCITRTLKRPGLFTCLKQTLELPMTETEDTFFCVAVVPLPTLNYFELFVSGCIFLNAVVLSSSHTQQGEGWDDLQRFANYAFVGVYTAECLIKVVGLGWRGYWHSRFNRFDFVIVCQSLLSFALPVPSGVAVLRLLRVARLIRLVRTAKGLNTMLTTLTKALPQLGNVAVLVGTVVFVFAAIGVDVFGNLDKGDGLSEFSNFRDIYHAIVTLSQTTTTEGWADLMDKITSAGISEVVSRLYFMLFVLLVSVLLLNLYVAVVVEGYQTASLRAHSKERMTRLFAPFTERWQRRDTLGSGKLHADCVLQLLREEARLDSPLWTVNYAELWAHYQSEGRLGSTEFQQTLRALKELCIPVTKRQQVYFTDITTLLSMKLYQIPLWVGMELTRGTSKALRNDWYALHHYLAVRKLAQWNRRGRATVRFAGRSLMTMPGGFRKAVRAALVRADVSTVGRMTSGIGSLMVRAQTGSSRQFACGRHDGAMDAESYSARTESSQRTEPTTDDDDSLFVASLGANEPFDPPTPVSGAAPFGDSSDFTDALTIRTDTSGTAARLDSRRCAPGDVPKGVNVGREQAPAETESSVTCPTLSAEHGGRERPDDSAAGSETPSRPLVARSDVHSPVCAGAMPPEQTPTDDEPPTQPPSALRHWPSELSLESLRISAPEPEPPPDTPPYRPRAAQDGR
eukprot:TRINITY_DN12893_c0_g1_i2.p1 TRINITY_DN12893_c0_g1~~TRINITY_DN12893_c0_g1_i2.p1  ORF type:complete len:2152 (+),score=533.99 TRINITY_DN12893_c0_g1_i2:83-6538(+)